MASLQQRLIGTLAQMLMNFVSKQPSNLPEFICLNTVLAQPMQQSKEWHVSVTPDNRNHLVRTL